MYTARSIEQQKKNSEMWSKWKRAEGGGRRYCRDTAWLCIFVGRDYGKVERFLQLILFLFGTIIEFQQTSDFKSSASYLKGLATKMLSDHNRASEQSFQLFLSDENS